MTPGLLLLLLLAGCDRAAGPPGVDLASAEGGAPADFAAPSVVDAARARDGGFGTALGAVKLTYYYVASESDFSPPDDTALCDVSTAVLATVPLAFAKALAIEGSGRLVDGRLLNVGGSCACSSGMTSCYIVLDPAKYPWGVGASSRPLRPFRSIAVDRSFIALGEKVYVPELDGVQMPASYGFVHDGCLDAEDVGGGIVGAHIDFFVAEKANYLSLDGALKLSSVTVFTAPPRCP